MAVLALVSRRIDSARNGYDLRVANLCAQLPVERHLVVLPIADADHDDPPSLDAGSIFSSVEELPSPLTGLLRPGRHLRRSNDDFLRLSQPAVFVEAARRIAAAVERHGVTHAIVFGSDLAEFGPVLRGCVRVVDVCDSISLRLRREIAVAPPGARVRRAKDRLSLVRSRASEAQLPDRFERVVAISDADRQEILDLHGPAANVYTVPNGVAEQFLRPLGAPGRQRGVAFWGNLSFPPNEEALRYYVHGVHRPFLRARGVELCVVGGSAPAWLTELAARDDTITVTGFVPDLREVVARYPIMINPMRSGGGLKNKVLEAFGLGLVVVSTPLGVEAIPQASTGRHFVAGIEPGELARAVVDLLDDDVRRSAIRKRAFSLVNEHYRWEAIAERWCEVLGLEGPAGAVPDQSSAVGRHEL